MEERYGCVKEIPGPTKNKTAQDILFEAINNANIIEYYKNNPNIEISEELQKALDKYVDIYKVERYEDDNEHSFSVSKNLSNELKSIIAYTCNEPYLANNPEIIYRKMKALEADIINTKDNLYPSPETYKIDELGDTSFPNLHGLDINTILNLIENHEYVATDICTMRMAAKNLREKNE